MFYILQQKLAGTYLIGLMHCRLMCLFLTNIPMNLILPEIGILAEWDSVALVETVNCYLATSNGRRFQLRRFPLGFCIIKGLQRNA